METIAEVIIEIVVLFVMVIPGACIRWFLNFGRVPLKEILNKDGYSNGVIGLLTVVGLGTIVKYTLL